MGFVSDIIGGVTDLFGAKNKFKAERGTSPEQIGQVFGQGQDIYGRQTSLADALQQQEALKAQSQILAALQATAAGQGPNPALEQLRQTTGQNIQGATGLIASQKGINPALAARYALGAGANANQQAAGQAATLAAQQQLAAQGQAGDLASQMAQQRIAQLGGMGGQNLQQQGILQGALANQNQINAGVAQQNAGFGQKLLGGALSGFGAGLGSMGLSSFGAGLGPGKAHGGVIEPASELGQRMAGLNMKGGGHVPGKAKVRGDSARNDTVPAVLSPGEIVIPRSHAGSPEDAAEFVAALKSEKGKGTPREMAEGGLVEAFKTWMGARGEESEPASKGVAEEISKKLPEKVMPRGAIEKKRKQLADLDEQTRGD